MSTTTAIYYHAGCPVCVDAERALTGALDPARFRVELVHLGQQRARIAEAERAGVRSVPALVIDGTVLHINHGATIAQVKG